MSKCLENEAGSGLFLKRVTGTRWSEREDATKALSYGYSSFQKALSVIAKDVKQKPETIHEAKISVTRPVEEGNSRYVSLLAFHLEKNRCSR